MNLTELCVRYGYDLYSNQCCCYGCTGEPLYFGIKAREIHLRCKQHCSAEQRVLCRLVASLEHLEYYLRLGELL